MNEWMIESANHSEFVESHTDFMLQFIEGGRKPDIFQIDGNFGIDAIVTEALCRYFDGKAHILYALPESWKTGSV